MSHDHHQSRFALGGSPHDLTGLDQPADFHDHDELPESAVPVAASSDDRIFRQVEYVVVPGRPGSVRRRIEGILQLVAEAELRVGHVIGVCSGGEAWVLVEVVEADTAVHVVELLGTALAEATGSRVVALIGASLVCRQIEKAAGDGPPGRLAPGRTVLLAEQDGVEPGT
ncbi:MAG: hypothetical protein MK085_07845 [Phycisphaerales bacterium]|nr:hypothetical protein [Phycisphaerales bacterium]